VVETRVGYTGGSTESPTYRRLGDHTEAFRVEYDPGVVSYDDLLAVFWMDHDPGQGQWSRQYRTAVFYHDPGQKERAVQSRDRIASARGIEVTTAIEPAGAFYPAEDYHQKHYLRRHGGLVGEYTALYPMPEDFVRSTAVARVNGFLGGNGTLEDLEAAMAGLGLSARGERRLRDYVATSSPRRACPVPAKRKPNRIRDGASREPSPAR
jgi:methionine-S-sulfoxide reductase